MPSVDATNIGLTYTFARINTGSVIVDAADSDLIADSTAGGTIYCNTAGQTYATISLRLITATQWAIVGAHGTWTTT